MSRLRHPKRIGISTTLLFLLVGFILNVCSPVEAADWPMWRYDAGRTAVSPEELPRQMHLLWMRELPAPHPAWPPTQMKLQFDLSYEPVVMKKTIFVPSMVNDSVTAYDIETGTEKWRFFTDAPVRFAPVGWHGKLYFVSDDGYLYCVDAKKGALLWKFLGGPSDRKILGNERLISTWPARGAPVIYDNTIYFAAGIWPFMGIFIHALDAETGRVIWTTSGSSSIYILQQHESPAFAGVAPQGYLAATEDRLLVAGGRTVPAVYDRRTGKFLYFEVADRSFGKDTGSYAVASRNGWFVTVRMPGQTEPAHGAMFRLSNGEPICATNATVMTKQSLIGVDDKHLAAFVWQPEKGEIDPEKAKVQKEKRQEYFAKYGVMPISKRAPPYFLRDLWRLPIPDGIDRAYLKAGSRVYCGGPGLVAAMEIPSEPGKQNAHAVSWQASIDGTPWTMLAADGNLFVVTQEGKIYCFGERKNETKTYDLTYKKDAVSKKSGDMAEAILEQTGVTEGWCLALGIENGDMIEELARRSKLTIIALDANADKIAKLRRRLSRSGLYGARIHALVGDIASIPLPPFMASLIVSENIERAMKDSGEEFVTRVFRTLRPYGGVACFGFSSPKATAFENLVKKSDLVNAHTARTDRFAFLARVGALPDSSDWTHQYGDAANTVVSKDARVRAPLGLLWFGGPSHADVLPRHGHGPAPQIVDGRLIIEGPDMLRAIDVYTGRLLWKTELKGLGTYYDETKHQPGANETGGNYVSLNDGIYVVYGESILRLDPATGIKIGEFLLPVEQGGEQPNWSYLGVWEDLLIAGASPIHVFFPKPKKARRAQRQTAQPEQDKEKEEPSVTFNARYGQGSRTLVAMDRHNGEVLWSRDAAYNFRHNAIAIGSGKVFCIDGMTEQRLGVLKRRGIKPEDSPRLIALDARTGDEVWNTEEKVFGTWLSYSEKYDVLFEAGSKGPDRAIDEVSAGMAAYRGADGKPLWKKAIQYEGPCMIRQDTIITQTGKAPLEASPAMALSLLTGEMKTRTHPMTGEVIPWSWVRFKGCNTAIASEHLLSFRSAAASYIDLETGQGTTSIGGFKSGCTSNLIAANGVLSAPDYTRTCTCSYQNQTSLAFVSIVDDPSLKDFVEGWSYDYYPTPEKPAPVWRVGINFGAPGNRFAPDGTLWIECPSVGGPSPDIPVRFGSGAPIALRSHASRFSGGGLNWVAASGIKGVKKIAIRPFVQPAPLWENEKENVKNAVEIIEAFINNPLRANPPEAPEPQGQFETPRSYTVRLVFAELENLKPAQRVFDVSIQGKKALNNFDIAREDSPGSKVIVHEFKNVSVEKDLTIELHPSGRAPESEPLICGIELVIEE